MLALLPLPGAAIAGCGGISAQPAAEAIGRQLTIYSGMPLQGADAAASKQIVGGEKLALADAGGRVGRFAVSFASLDDSSATTGRWDPNVTAANARVVAQDPTTIAYIGDLDSGATAISLPLIDGAGIPQVSPGSPYVGLASSRDAGQDEPERFFPTGKRTFARIVAGDPVQAAAQVAALRAKGVRKVYVLADQDPFDGPLAQMVAEDARRVGIEASGPDDLTIAPGASFTGEVAKVAAAGAQAVFVSAAASSQAAQLFGELHEAEPALDLFASSAMLSPIFTGGLGAAEASTTVGSPTLPPATYPPQAQRVLSEYARNFGEAGDAHALYGYEAMSLVLASIRAAGAHGDQRQAVIEKLLATRNRRSVLGSYSIQPSGETTLSTYAVEKVVRGEPSFWREFAVSP